MEAATVHRLASEALLAAGLVRRGRSRFEAQPGDLAWSVMLDRGASYRSWSAQFSVVVQAWASDGEEHLRQDYAAFGDRVPPTAAGYRWDDHGSYFTAAFNHQHEHVRDALPEEERRTAFAFMAAELSDLFSRVPDLPTLCAAVRDGRFRSAAVSRRLHVAALS